MIGTVRRLLRLTRVATTLARVGLSDLIAKPGSLTHRILGLLPAEAPGAARGARVRLALERLGPIFVKFGQILSTRRDLLPPDIADELALLQDRVKPFPGDQARRRIEAALGTPIETHFDLFEELPLASASIAQVHAARLKDGAEVVLKVLRPGIEKQIRTDLELLRSFARIADRVLPDRERIRPLELVSEIERTLYDELDLQREGANCAQIGRNFAGSPTVKVPSIVWPLSKPDVLVMERVSGIPINDIDALRAAGVNLAQLAEEGIRLFYTQVFRDNFFHADMHPGNIFVDPTNPALPRFVLLDFGICGALSREDQRYLAGNFDAIFHRRYRRVAELHIEAGWMPRTIRVDELEMAVRSVCEPYFTRPLAEISLGEVLAKLFRVAHRYKLTVQPQLLLLQKTLLNIEGIGRNLHPRLDIWATAEPVLTQILNQQYGPAGAWRELQERLPAWAERAPDMPGLIHEYLQQATQGRLHLNLVSPDLAQIRDEIAITQRRTIYAVLGSGLIIAGSVLHTFEGGGPTLVGLGAYTWIAIVGALAAFRAAWPR